MNKNGLAHEFRFSVGAVCTVDEEFEWQPGDMVAIWRPSWLGLLLWLLGDPILHVGIIFERNGELYVKEHAMRKRPLRKMTSLRGSQLLAVGRPALSTNCRQAVLDAIEREDDEPTAIYGYWYCAMIALAAIARSVCPQRWSRAGELAAIAIARASERNRPAAVLTCSGFVDMLYSHACEGCWPRLTWPTRATARVGAGAPWAGDFVRLRRARSGFAAPRSLISPTDIWMAPAFEFRAVIDDEADEVILLRDGDSVPVPVDPRRCWWGRGLR